MKQGKGRGQVQVTAGQLVLVCLKDVAQMPAPPGGGGTCMLVAGRPMQIPMGLRLAESVSPDATCPPAWLTQPGCCCCFLISENECRVRRAGG